MGQTLAWMSLVNVKLYSVSFSVPMQFYQSGVFDSSSCSNTKLNHAMLVTGYGSYNGKDYWLVKNR